MGLDNSLELSTHLTIEAALGLMADHLGLRWGDETHLAGPGISISVIRPVRNFGLMIEEAFQFKPDLSIGFWINSQEEGTPDVSAEGHRIMLRATMLLLEHGGDGVLLFNGEHIILQRIKGRLVLNAENRNWTDGLRLEQEVRLPHDKHPLRSPLL